VSPRPKPAERSDTIPEYRRRDTTNWYRTDGVERETYTVAEAAAALGIGLKLAYELTRTGQIPTIRLGRRVLVSRATLDSILSGGD